MSHAEQLEATDLAMALLSHMHWWGTAWKPAKEPEAGHQQTSPASTSQAVLQLLARLTKSHDMALGVSPKPTYSSVCVSVCDIDPRASACMRPCPLAWSWHGSPHA